MTDFLKRVVAPRARLSKSKDDFTTAQQPSSKHVSTTELSGRARGLSQDSIKALDYLDKVSRGLDSAFEEFSILKRKLELSESVSVAIEVKNKLALLNGKLEKLQANVDGVVTEELKSGKEEVRSIRKGLNARIETLTDDVLSLCDECIKRLKREEERMFAEKNRFVLE